MADVLVVGGNGFIGTHVTDSLLRAGHDVTVFDMFGTVSPRWSEPGADLIDGNFLNETDVRAAVRGRDVVLHLLSTTDPASAEGDPTLDVRTNVISSIFLFESCAEAGVGHVYFASSGGSIYGDQPGRRFREDSPTFPVSPYAIGKSTIENYLRYFNRKKGLRSTSLRISNPYGTRQNPRKRQGIIPIFLRRVRDGLPLTIMGDGNMVRDYIYVNDLADIIAKVITRGARQDLYNVGSGQPTSVMDVYHAIVSVTGRTPVIERTPTPPTYIDHVTLDVGRLHREFGPLGLTPLHEGIMRTWEEIRDAAV